MPSPSAPTVLRGDCREVMEGMSAQSIDAIVTDPPYGISLMGKRWDYDVPGVEVWKAALRVLKPGGHLLAFASARTYHRMAVAIEDAGFEIRDQLMWLYATGFPKTRNLSLQLDERLGVADKRKVLGVKVRTDPQHNRPGFIGPAYSGRNESHFKDVPITAPHSDIAKRYDGWGTALKPCHEPIVMARKPIDGTVTDAVIAFGTGAIRLGNTAAAEAAGESKVAGNVLHDGSSDVEFRFPVSNGVGASRFFFCPKPSRVERELGAESLEAVTAAEVGAEYGDGDGDEELAIRNIHPTVKPIHLMRYLVRLVTPPGGVVLDPFCGSGSTLCGAVLAGHEAIGIEMDERYAAITEARAAWWSENLRALDEQGGLHAPAKDNHPTLF